LIVQLYSVGKRKKQHLDISDFCLILTGAFITSVS